MQTVYNLKMPHAVYGGENSIDNITTILKNNQVKRVAIFTDKGILASGLFDLPEAAVKAAGADYYVLDEIPPEPSYMAVQNIVDRFKASGADMIIACGGGSVLDAAKLASVLVTDEYGVKELLDEPGRAKKCVPSILIPTTAGTGAEVTPNAIVAVPEKELKVGIVNENMIADYVILDARMIKNLPRPIAAATGVDALAHAIECYTSKKANPFSDTFAMEALDLILNNIIPACDDPEAMEAKNQMQIAAFYAGIAITASGTTAVHALSYPLGGKYHIAHGVSNAILLAPVMRFNAPVCKERFTLIYDRCCHDTDNISKTTEEKVEWVIMQLERIVQHLDIPTSLKEFGVPQEDLDGLVEAGMQVQRLLINNMRLVTEEDARNLYLEIL
jgi:alcohol dehydrogenase class IV